MVLENQISVFDVWLPVAFDFHWVILVCEDGWRRMIGRPNFQTSFESSPRGENCGVVTCDRNVVSAAELMVAHMKDAN